MSGTEDTIFALATAPGKAALAVVRISGARAGEVLEAIAGRKPHPRRATVRRLRAADGSSLDDALVLWFPGPGSYTGEDVAELHLHGGRAVVAGVLEALGGRGGVRLARPGEFTRRAFERGRVDLAQAEAVADLIDAETAAQRRQALDQLGGALSNRHETWRALLLEALAWLEASVDFPDEDLPELISARVDPTLERLERALTEAGQDADRGRRVRDGYRVAMIGAPNAGKSTLLNALVGREAAIVTAIPGTTRDVIEVSLDLDGYAVVFADTAGLRDSDDPVEIEGVRRAHAWAASADLRLWVCDPSQTDVSPPPMLRPDDLIVLSKSDLGIKGGPEQGTPVSALDVESVSALKRIVARRVVEDLSGAEFPSATRLRHQQAIETALASIKAARGRYAEPELAAEEVQRAARMLHLVTGRLDVEQVLDRVFASFCIGK